MKLTINLNSTEKAYLSHVFRKCSPKDYDEGFVFGDYHKQTEAYIANQSNDSNGNFEASLDIKSELFMDVVDVAVEAISQLKNFSFMLKGAAEGIKCWGKGIATRFEKWFPKLSDEAARKEAEESAQRYVEDPNMDDDEFVCVVVNTDREPLCDCKTFTRSHTFSRENFCDLKTRAAESMKEKRMGKEPKAYFFLRLENDGPHTILLDEESLLNSGTIKKAMEAANDAITGGGFDVHEGDFMVIGTCNDLIVHIGPCKDQEAVDKAIEDIRNTHLRKGTEAVFYYSFKVVDGKAEYANSSILKK